MLHRPSWRIESTAILTKREIAAVLADQRRKSERSLNTRMNLVIFRLACCCGLRVSEISQLQLADIRVGIDKPHIVIRPTIAKGGHGRKVPLWWDKGTLDDIAAWVAYRRGRGSQGGDPLVCSLSARRASKSLGRHVLRKRFRTACRVLGVERLKGLTIHHGRHTFISYALAGGRTIAEVMGAAGHTNVSITSCYVHIASDGAGVLGNLFSSRD